MMTRFVRKLLCFMAPFIMLFIFATFFIGVGIYTYELRASDDAIECQRKNPDYLLGMAYNEQNKYYKFSNSNYYKADILALGSSRVMQIRNAYFKQTFYNAGGGVSYNYDEYLNFIRNLDYTPKLVILGIDCWVFNDNWNHKAIAYLENEGIPYEERDGIVILKSIFNDWLEKKWCLEQISDSNNIGMNAIVKENGFRVDGSYFNGDRYRNPTSQSDYLFKDTYSRIDQGINRFEYGTTVDEDTVVMLEELLAYCKEADIEVVGFSAPLAPSVFDYMMESGHYKYVNDIGRSCQELFDKYAFCYMDFLDGNKLPFGDDYYLDGFHGSEIVYAEIIMELAEESDFLRESVQVEVMRDMINNRYDNYRLTIH